MSSEASMKQERLWRGRPVDANLRDEWLVDLNRMRLLELRSICEGHVARVDPLSRNAQIIATVGADRRPFFHRHWDDLREPIGDLLAAHFCRGDARVSFGATREITWWPGTRGRAASDTLFLRATKRHARRCREIDEETVLWLERTVATFMALDEDLLGLYEGCAGESGPA